MECGCVPPNLGGNLGNSCGGTTMLFMALLDIFISKKCDISEICQRVKPIVTPDLEYDYVVIGGGSGGSTAAGRLVQKNMGKVLLVEAGGDEPPGSQVASLGNNYFNNPEFDWSYKTEPEPVGCQGYPDKRCNWIRGKVLGGTSVLNGMMYMRGVPRDYDNWEAAGNPGWSYKDVFPAFKAQEDNEQIGSLVEAEYHGTGGPWTVAQFPDYPKFAEDVLEAGREIGYPVLNDLNGKDFVGFTIAQTNNRNGTRLSAARAYLRPQRDNPHLHVMLKTLATKIGVEIVNGEKKATEVYFEHANQNYSIRVRKEIILAGGTVNSPQLLLLSGIGPKNELDRLGIPIVHELPGVGKNLQNHVSFKLSFILNKTDNYNDMNWAQVVNYLLNRQGLLASTGMSQVTARTNSKYADSTGDYPDLQLFFSGYLASCSETGEVNALANPVHPSIFRQVGISPVNLHPKSKGYLTLKSRNPYDAPLIYANYITEADDVKILVEGVRLALALSKSKHLIDKYGIQLVHDNYGDCNQSTYDTDDFWNCAVKYLTSPENHQTGTCKMGPDSDPEAVVNSKLQIKGIPNLRVMDGSIIPFPLSGNTAAPIMMVAHRGVDFIEEHQQAIKN